MLPEKVDATLNRTKCRKTSFPLQVQAVQAGQPVRAVQAEQEGQAVQEIQKFRKYRQYIHYYLISKKYYAMIKTDDLADIKKKFKNEY